MGKSHELQHRRCIRRDNLHIPLLFTPSPLLLFFFRRLLLDPDPSYTSYSPIPIRRRLQIPSLLPITIRCFGVLVPLDNGPSVGCSNGESTFECSVQVDIREGVLGGGV